MDLGLALIALLIATAGLIVVLGARASAPEALDRWSSAHGLVLTERNRPMVVHFLRSARQLRLAGAALGFAAPPAVATVLGGDAGTVPGGLIWVIAGGLFGAFCAEVVIGRPLNSTERGASLVPRELHDYLPQFVRRAQWIVGAAAGVLAVIVAVVGRDRARFDGMSPLSTPAALALGGIAVSGAVALDVAQRWVLRRPQPVVATDLLKADDAIRSESLASIAGAGLAILLFLLGNLWWQLALSDIRFLRWTAWVPAVACWVAAPVVWLRLRHVPWQVSRHRTLRPSEAA